MNAIYQRLSHRLLRILLLPLALATFASAGTFHTLDTTQDGRIDLDELLRAIQFYNSLEYHCAAGTEDGYAPDTGVRDCIFHDLDIAPQDWRFSIDELLRAIQFYNSIGYAPTAGTEDEFSLGTHPTPRPDAALDAFDHYDYNKDTRLSQEEAAAANLDIASFVTADTNVDDAISRREFLTIKGLPLTIPPSPTPPTLTLLGDSEVTLACGEEYGDPGVLAFDAEEGDLSAAVLRTPEVLNLNTAGSLTITYVVSDRECNTATTSRVVNIEIVRPPEIRLLGENPATTNCGYTYNDAGITIDDPCYRFHYAVETDTTALDPDVLGSYLVTYRVTAWEQPPITVTRTVNVVDTHPPIFGLRGQDSMLLELGQIWEEPGTIAYDNCDTPVVQLPPPPDTTQLGPSTLTYTATDSSGNSATLERKIYVYDSSTPMNTITTQGGVAVFSEFTPTPAIVDASGAHFPADSTVQVTCHCWYGYESGAFDPCGIELQVDDQAPSKGDCGITVSLDMTSDHTVEYYALYHQDCVGKSKKNTAIPDVPKIVPDASTASITTPPFADVDYYGPSSSPMAFPRYVAKKTPKSDDEAFRQTSTSPAMEIPFHFGTASYLLGRRKVNADTLPSPDNVDSSEYLSHFNYLNPPFSSRALVGQHTEIADCPWATGHQLLYVSVAMPSYIEPRPPLDLAIITFTGNSTNALSTQIQVEIRTALSTLANNHLQAGDRLALYTTGYAPESLPLTYCTPENQTVLANGIANFSPVRTSLATPLALAFQRFKENDRVATKQIVIISSRQYATPDFERYLLETSVPDDTSTSVLGYKLSDLAGTGLPTLAETGRGRYTAVDTAADLNRALEREVRSGLKKTGASARLSIEFDPDYVSEYRLVAAGAPSSYQVSEPSNAAPDLYQGDRLTALFELITELPAFPGAPLGILNFESREPSCTRQRRVTHLITGLPKPVPGLDMRFAAAVAEFAMLLSDSPYKGSATYQSALQLAIESLGEDPYGHRAEFVELVQRAAQLAK